ncbi:hypothetical protein CHLRE_02g078600v5 [Chlamydomonas reinhardtii]|uniref:Radial spike protein 8 n=1 Tax=Chlamydomonas reinhardtii TaxID=3055 RepID=Q27YU6_CHLRE|nr:uncharacterized protein CHLRE_02g078600v5 [Chlamydomonas reinhardtii]ABC02019.1 radial spike protein 8 [Chlamydomonas reinhardtii]PNW86246.1 hypothetical protein CHLRE_02g078600v5 [Chlamydomonas reinhardtii]7JU4_n Chain n, Radial spike protein 8 [Chlamydomonas reinhardtii]8GLV_Kb Chain Kb, Radial spike protein 8 [Chlamydomonas reinhardtii]|eukprot:XP_001701869.1 radial spoke protein 8 [Chlamydomonas reinhardtii]
MQSHSSRHVVSEHLKDLHPDLSEPFPKHVIEDEVAEAHGRRAIPKLVAVLALPELPDDQRAHALRVLNGLLSTQEHKTNAVAEGAAPPLCQLASQCRDDEVRRLSCSALASLGQVMAGRNGIVAAGGLPVLTEALQTTPEQAAAALKSFAASNDGAAQLNLERAAIVPALVTLLSQPTDPAFTLTAFSNALSTLEGMTRTDDGVLAALDGGVPACLVALARRGLEGDLKFEGRLMELLQLVATCLEQICHHADGKAACRQAEAHKVLAELLTLQHREIIKHAAAALMGLAVEKESKVNVMLYAGVSLVRLMRGSDAELAANARDTVAAAAEHLEARRTAEMLLSMEERELLLWRGPPPETPPDYRYHVDLPKFTPQAK